MQLRQLWDQLKPFEEPEYLDEEAAAVNSSSNRGTVAYLFFLLDLDGNGTLQLDELRVLHGSESKLRDFFTTWCALALLCHCSYLSR